ncbi:hypothetical protein X560_1099 [Listeria fleischmannii 1991]|uniref:LXG domain-containing protein n=2 Tax=Listeria fleischmannii TaxID=1069827 RepID=A0A0J8GHF2_9LIST|nr:hypothetical protein [Listeria fleischmannii]EMG27043.1 hypothetical protein LFLEISCH_13110 [Listeria fleischmannii subsp. fleischmannii LU2006-1]KMT60173.1 hypothetical protein X560_1099 [Listeria fleischmannii 1991]
MILGFEMIQINSVIFFALVGAAQKNAGDFLADADSMPEITSKSVALDNFIDQFKEMQSVLESYKTLLKKDLTTIHDIGNSLVETDNALGRGIQNGLSN